MNRFIPLLAIVLAAVAQPAVSQTCAAVDLPSGAAALGYTVQMFHIVPTVAMVSTTDTNSTSALYPGEEFASVAANLEELKYLSMVNGVFTFNYTGAAATAWISSETHQATQGTIPLLLGSKGFYIEAGIRLSSSDPDHYPSFFLMPAEHNTHKSDHIATSPSGYENWVELDALEEEDGGLAQHDFINYQGIYPNYTRTVNFWRSPHGFDWTEEHVFGLSFDPVARVVQFYLDGKPTLKASMVASPTIVDAYHYYFILGARSHGLNKPYQMYVNYVAAYSK
jgi:hypothetical protein